MEDLNFKNRLQYYGSSLSKSEARIAEFILAHPEESAANTIIDLAKKIGTSNPSITRFCKKLKYRNYGEFQTLLLADNTNTASPSSIIHKISHYYQIILESSMELVDESSLYCFIDHIVFADRILICGIGSSGLAANEFNIRLVRMGIKSMAVSDSHLMLAQTSLFSQKDLVIALSNSGETIEIIKTCQTAKSLGIPVCLLTQNNNTALTKTADTILFTSNINQISDPNYINSQFPLLFLIDALTYGLLENPCYQDKYQKTLHALAHRNDSRLF